MSVGFIEGLQTALSSATYITTFNEKKQEKGGTPVKPKPTERNLLDDFNYVMDEKTSNHNKEIVKSAMWNAVMRSTFNYAGESYTVKRASEYLQYVDKSKGKEIPFGNPAQYNLTLSVNGISENIASYNGKLWGSRFNSDRKRKNSKENATINKVATMPGFKTINFHTIPNRKTVTKFLSSLDFTALETIYAVPYQITPNLNEKDKEALIKMAFAYTDVAKYKKLYNKYLHRLNHGVDFGEIKVSYMALVVKEEEAVAENLA
jgi:hypothetical protein